MLVMWRIVQLVSNILRTVWFVLMVIHLLEPKLLEQLAFLSPSLLLIHLLQAAQYLDPWLL